MRSTQRPSTLSWCARSGFHACQAGSGHSLITTKGWCSQSWHAALLVAAEPSSTVQAAAMRATMHCTHTLHWAALEARLLKDFVQQVLHYMKPGFAHNFLVQDKGRLSPSISINLTMSMSCEPSCTHSARSKHAGVSIGALCWLAVFEALQGLAWAFSQIKCAPGTSCSTAAAPCRWAPCPAGGCRSPACPPRAQPPAPAATVPSTVQNLRAQCSSAPA